MLPQPVLPMGDSCSNSEEEALTTAVSATDAVARAAAAERSGLQLRIVLMVLRVAKRCAQTFLSKPALPGLQLLSQS